MAFSKSQQQVWIGDKKGVVHVHNAIDGAEVQKYEKHTKTVSSICVSEDGTKAASGDMYRYFHVYDCASLEIIGEHGYHKGTLYSVSLSEDGSKLLSVAQDLTFGVLNVATGKSKQVKNPHLEKNP
jgi:WD40 repeat protein